MKLKSESVFSVQKYAVQPNDCCKKVWQCGTSLHNYQSSKWLYLSIDCKNHDDCCCKSLNWFGFSKFIPWFSRVPNKHVAFLFFLRIFFPSYTFLHLINKKSLKHVPFHLTNFEKVPTYMFIWTSCLLHQIFLCLIKSVFYSYSSPPVYENGS